MTFKIPIKNRYIVSVILGLGTLGLVLLLGFIFQADLEEWEEKSLDYRFRLRKSVPTSSSITTIGIEDESLEKIGTWPWDRSFHARMITILKNLGVSVINSDIFFTARSTEPGDSLLIKAVQEAGNVILSAPFELIDHPCFTQKEYQEFVEKFPHAENIVSSLKTQKDDKICVDFNALSDKQWNALTQEGQEAGFELLYHAEFAFTGEEDEKKLEVLLDKFDYPFTIHHKEQLWYANRAYLPIQELSQAALAFGHVSASPDSDGVFRRVPLMIRVKDHVIPHMALTAVLHYLQVTPKNVIVVPGKHILLQHARFPDTNTLEEIKIPVDDRLRLRINFSSSWGTHYSFADVLAAEDDPETADFLKNELNGDICTLGFLVSGTGDIGPNPIETNFPLPLIHAAIMNTILTQNFQYDTGWEINIGLTLLLVVFLGVISPRLGPYRFTLAVFLTIGVYVAAAILLFNLYGIILKLVNPVLPALILEYTLITVYWYSTEDRERRQLRSAFKTYVSKQMLAQIIDNPQSLALTGQRKEVSIMFSDVRKFSTLSDKIEPEVIHRLLNLYFSQMTQIAFKYDGFVDKFIGDGLLCFFGDPISHHDHALRAVRAAIDMQHAVRRIGPEIQETLGLDPIVIRIGINTGSVIVGNMGSAERMEYTVLGSEVNLAQRLEASATPGQIMISHKTYDYVKQDVDARDMGDIKVKGFEKPVKVYEVKLPFE